MTSSFQPVIVPRGTLILLFPSVRIIHTTREVKLYLDAPWVASNNKLISVYYDPPINHPVYGMVDEWTVTWEALRES